MTNLVSDKFKNITIDEAPKEIVKEVINKHLNAVERTRVAINTRWQGDNARINQAQRFIKKALKSDKKRKQEKASRKRNRR